MKIPNLPIRLFRIYNRQQPIMVAAILFVVLGCLSLIGLDGWNIWQERAKELHNSEIIASNLARSLAQHAEDVVFNADSALLGVVERVEKDGDGAAARDRLHALLASRVTTSPWLHGVSVFDAQGDRLVDSETNFAPNINYADRDYFIYHRTHAERGPHIGLPVRSRLHGDWVLTVSRRIDHRDGSFAGVAVAIIGMDYLQKFYRSFDLGAHGSVVLLQDNGIVLVRSPFYEAMIGKSLAAGPIFSHYLKQSDSGVATIKSALDGTVRVNGFLHLAHYPLVVDVALSMEDILAGWRSTAYLHAAGVAILVMVLGALGYRVVDQIRLRLQVEGQLSESERRLRTITDNVPAFISYIDREQRYRFCNAYYVKEFGVPMDQLLGKSMAEMFGAEGYATVAPYVARALAGEKLIFEREALERGPGRYSLYHYIPDLDQSGGAKGFYAMVLDITDRKNAELKLIKLARVDALTGLPNRVRFDENLREAMARSRRSGMAMAVMYLDIDHFKTINDTYGHQAGDEALSEFARRLATSIRKTDSAARLSGDEFVIILEEMKTDGEAEVVARKIINKMETDFVLAGKPHKVSASIGIAVLRENDADPQTLLRRADQALYRAKAEGRNTYRVADK